MSTEIERSLNKRGQEYYNHLLGYGLILKDKELTDYVQNVLNNIKPKQLDSFDTKVYIVNDAEINAGIFPGGEIFVNIGLLVVLDNEAQLAFILSHELAHFIERHAFKRESLVSTNKKLDKELIKKIPQFSIENEFEADSLGFVIFRATNYDHSQSYKGLDKLPTQDSIVHVGFLHKLILGIDKIPLQTHPKTINRINNLKSYSNDSSGIVEIEIFKKKTDGLYIINLELTEKILNPLEYAIYLENLELTLNPSDSTTLQWLIYKIGEMYKDLYCTPLNTGCYIANMKKSKLLGYGYFDSAVFNQFKKYNNAKATLQEKAIVNLNRAMKYIEYFFKAHKNLGLICNFNKDFDCAKAHFRTYLESGQNIPDKRYINSLLDQIKKQ